MRLRSGEKAFIEELVAVKQDPLKPLRIDILVW
jgi:hypothetical protein